MRNQRCHHIAVTSTEGSTSRANGFTLIEMLIVVALISILASIAYPAYQDSIRKSRRSDAMAALQKAQSEQEKLRANCPFYAGGLTGTRACGISSAATLLGLTSTTSEGGFYTLSVSGASGTGYTVTATATGAQTSDTTCNTMSITVAGLNVSNTATNAASADTSSTCWVK